MFTVFYHQDFVQSQVFQEGDWLGDVRVRDLHFVDFIEVRLHCIERAVVEHTSDISIFLFRCNGYSRNQGITSNWKALLLNQVVIGRGMKLTRANTTLTQPPPGYDSVSTFGCFFFFNEGIDRVLGSCGAGPRRISELR